jgi:hypothetical protein
MTRRNDSGATRRANPRPGPTGRCRSPRHSGVQRNAIRHQPFTVDPPSAARPPAGTVGEMAKQSHQGRKPIRSIGSGPSRWCRIGGTKPTASRNHLRRVRRAGHPTDRGITCSGAPRGSAALPQASAIAARIAPRRHPEVPEIFGIPVVFPAMRAFDPGLATETERRLV